MTDLTLDPLTVKMVPQKMCAYHPDTPAHKASPFCLACCQKRGRDNAQIRQAKVEKISPQVETARLILARVPVFDPKWAEELATSWMQVMLLLTQELLRVR